MSEKPVAWMTPGGDVSRSLEWCKERCWPEGAQPTPLYSQSPTEARALAIAEAARMVDHIEHSRRLERQRDAAVEALKELAAEEWRDDDDPILGNARAKARAVLREIEGES